MDRREFLTLSGLTIAGLAFTGGKRALAAPVAENALENQTLTMYNNLYAWLGRAGVPGYLGETVTPSSGKTDWTLQEVQKWLTLLEKVYQSLDSSPNIAAVSAHCAGLGSGNSGGFQVYGPHSTSVPLSQRNFVVSGEQASIIEAYPPTPTSMRGMNLSAGAMGTDTGFSAQSPGTYGTSYTYPDLTDCQFLKSRGFDLIRMPFRWERVQVRSSGNPSGDPALNSTEMARLKAALDAAHSAGLKVIPSVQNYGGYQFSTFTYSKLGSTTLPTAALGKLWKRLALAWKDHPAVVGYDIMNEPGEMPTANPAGLWQKASQETVNSIATVDAGTRVWIAGYHTRATGSFSGLYSFLTHHPNPWIVSGIPFGYTTHCYYGPGASYYQTYDEAVAMWAARGY